jgi:hypothetical protein
MRRLYSGDCLDVLKELHKAHPDRGLWSPGARADARDGQQDSRFDELKRSVSESEVRAPKAQCGISCHAGL